MPRQYTPVGVQFTLHASKMRQASMHLADCGLIVVCLVKSTICLSGDYPVRIKLSHPNGQSKVYLSCEVVA